MNRKTLAAISGIVVLGSIYLFATGRGDLMSRTSMVAQPSPVECHDPADPVLFWTEGTNFVRKMSIGCQVGKIRLNRPPPEIEGVVAGIGAGNNLRQIAADDHHLYWTDMNNHRIMKALRDVNDNTCPSSGCLPIVESGGPIAIDKPVGIAVDSDWVYWSDQSTGAIWKSHKDGSNPIPLLTEGAGTPTWLALDGDNLYFADWLNKKIMRVQTDIEAPIPHEIVTKESMADVGPFDPFGIAIHNGWLYWANKAGGKIQKIALDGDGGIQTLFSSTTLVKNPLGIAIDQDGEMIYWASSGGGKQAIRRVSINCSNCADKDVHNMALWMSNAGYPSGLWVGKPIPTGDTDQPKDAKGRLYWVDRSAKHFALRSADVPKQGELMASEDDVLHHLGDSTGQIVLDGDLVYIADSSDIKRTKRDGDPEYMDRLVDGMSSPSGLAIDRVNHWLYFTDKDDRSLWRLELNECLDVCQTVINDKQDSTNNQFVSNDASDKRINLTYYHINVSGNAEQQAKEGVKTYSAGDNTYSDDEYTFEYVSDGDVVNVKVNDDLVDTHNMDEWVLEHKTHDGHKFSYAEDQENIVSVENPQEIVILQKLMGAGTIYDELGAVGFLALDTDRDKLYMTENDKIWRVHLNDSGNIDPETVPVYLQVNGVLRGITIDVTTDRLYWVNRNHQHIAWMNNASSISSEEATSAVMHLVASDVKNASGLAARFIDGDGWVYWTSNSPGEIWGIYSKNGNKTGEQELIYNAFDQFSNGLALDTPETN